MFRALRLVSLSLPLVALCACTGGTGTAEPAPEPDGPLDHRVEIPEPPENGMQFVQPDLVVPAGQEIQWCWIPEWEPDEDRFVKKFEGLQSEMGHHVVVLQSGIPREPGSNFDCTNLEQMVSMEPLITPNDLPDGSAGVMPDGYAVRLPAGAQLVIQSHYVNYTDEDIRVADVARLEFVDEGEAFTEASYFVVNHGGIDVPPGENGTSVECTVSQRIELIALIGHMHDWGKAITIDHTHVADDTVDEMYAIDEWTVDMRDYPPITRYEDTPYVLEPGDKVTVDCDYNNTTDGNLRFPTEMCVAFGVYAPALPEGFIICD